MFPALSMSTVISARFANEESPTVAVAVFCPAVIATGLDRILVPLSLMSIVGLPLLDVVVKETFTAVSVNAYGILNVVFAVPACNVVVSSEAEIMNASVGVEDIGCHELSPLRYVDELAVPVADNIGMSTASTAIVVAFPELVTSPVKFAFVVTVPDVKPDAVPVRFVATPLAGVPNAGVVSVGEVKVNPATVETVAPDARTVLPKVGAV